MFTATTTNLTKQIILERISQSSFAGVITSALSNPFETYYHDVKLQTFAVVYHVETIFCMGITRHLANI
jgi:hypothetical protein